MALRNVLQFGDEMLRKKSRDVTVFDDKLWVLLDDMQATMKSHNGVGLAAPQVGILRRVAIVDTGDEIVELINPVITSKKGKQYELEGCLSSPGSWGYVERPEKVKIKSLNRYGKKQEHEGEGMVAVAFCHETDHLDGILFIDMAEEMLTPEEVEEMNRRNREADNIQD